MASNLAYLYVDKHDFEKAIEWFSAVISNSKVFAARAYGYRAILYDNLQQFEAAIKDYRAIMMEYKWISNSTHNKIAEIYIKMGLFDKAIKECNLVINNKESKNLEEIYSANKVCIPYITRGKAYMKMGNKDKALADFTQVEKAFIDFKPVDDSHYWYYKRALPYRGLLCFEQDEYEKALQYFNEAGTYLSHKFAEKQHAAYLALGKIKEADDVMQKIKSDESKNRYSQILLGHLVDFL
jgi:tetratricopeptide (TPR) repeat protein